MKFETQLRGTMTVEKGNVFNVTEHRNVLDAASSTYGPHVTAMKCLRCTKFIIWGHLDNPLL